MKNNFTALLCLAICFLSIPRLYAGTSKDAADFGFLPENDAETNAIALQSALEGGGGNLKVSIPGTYRLTNTIFIDSNTSIEFAEGTVIEKCRNSRGELPAYVFINRGAYTRTYDENISLTGLTIKMNGMDQGSDIEPILGLMGSVSFFYVKNLTVKDFTTTDVGYNAFALQVCTFENILLEDIHIEGMKDGIHLGRGKGFTIRNCRMRTFDDPIALNAHDYIISNPEIGWLEDGTVEGCTDMNDTSTTGFFCRILAGGWTDWQQGMEVQNSDAVVSNGRIYRVSGKPDGKKHISTYRPVHESGSKDYGDGIVWAMTQDRDVAYSCGVRNVTFKDIELEKDRSIAFSIYFDTNEYSRSYYPHAETPVQRNFTLENVHQRGRLDAFVYCITPVDTIRIRNCSIADGRLMFRRISAPGCNYGPVYVELDNVLFCGKKDSLMLFENDYDMDIRVSMKNCRTERPGMKICLDNVNVLSVTETREEQPVTTCRTEGRHIVVECRETDRVTIHDSAGKVLFNGTLHPGEHRMGEYPCGIYIVNGSKVII